MPLPEEEWLCLAAELLNTLEVRLRSKITKAVVVMGKENEAIFVDD